MIHFEEKYIDPYTNYGFVKLCGEEPNKDLLLDFLNELLKEEQGEIVDLTYLKSENLGDSDIDRKAIFDKWLYVLKNLNKLNRVPDKLREKIFDKLFETAEIAKFTPEQVQFYEDSLKYYRDIKNSLDTAKEEGREEGRIEEKHQIAKNLFSQGLDIELITKATGLSEEEIKTLK